MKLGDMDFGLILIECEHSNSPIEFSPPGSGNSRAFHEGDSQGWTL